MTDAQQAILDVATALAKTANELAKNAMKLDVTGVSPPNYANGYIHALQDILDEVGAVVPSGWQAP
jgi:hypothetical protein